jgi:hypothetical protein
MITNKRIEIIMESLFIDCVDKEFNKEITVFFLKKISDKKQNKHDFFFALKRKKFGQKFYCEKVWFDYPMHLRSCRIRMPDDFANALHMAFVFEINLA